MGFAKSVILRRLKALGNHFPLLSILPVNCLDLKLSPQWPGSGEGDLSYEDLTAARAEKL